MKNLAVFLGIILPKITPKKRIAIIIMMILIILIILIIRRRIFQSISEVEESMALLVCSMCASKCVRKRGLLNETALGGGGGGQVGFRISGLGFRGFRAWGLGFRVTNFQAGTKP